MQENSKDKFITSNTCTVTKSLSSNSVVSAGASEATLLDHCSMSVSMTDVKSLSSDHSASLSHAATKHISVDNLLAATNIPCNLSKKSYRINESSNSPSVSHRSLSSVELHRGNNQINIYQPMPNQNSASCNVSSYSKLRRASLSPRTMKKYLNPSSQNIVNSTSNASPSNSIKNWRLLEPIEGLDKIVAAKSRRSVSFTGSVRGPQPLSAVQESEKSPSDLPNIG